MNRPSSPAPRWAVAVPRVHCHPGASALLGRPARGRPPRAPGRPAVVGVERRHQDRPLLPLQRRHHRTPHWVLSEVREENQTQN